MKFKTIKRMQSWAKRHDNMLLAVGVIGFCFVGIFLIMLMLSVLVKDLDNAIQERGGVRQIAIDVGREIKSIQDEINQPAEERKPDGTVESPTQSPSND